MTRSSSRRQFSLFFCAVAFGCGLYLATSGRVESQSRMTDPPLVPVRTVEGTLIGEQREHIQVFRGVPYAKPPVGRLRFRAAVPATHWTKPRPARDPAPACWQVLDLDDPAEDGDRVMSEDCLTLNIWTPASDAGRRPVMVFIHGGGFEEGSAANSWYDGAALAKSGNVVVVTVQYRLGAFGFLELSHEGGPAFAGSGNIGLTDQIEALRWIKRNVATFGGDSSNVTLFGESAGGTSIRALLALPEVRTLFHKVIIESGPGLFASTARAQTIGGEFMRLAGVTSVMSLQKLDPREIINAQSKLFSAGFGGEPFAPVTDAPPFAKTPVKALATDPSLSKPMLIGTNAEELRYWIALATNGFEQQPESLMRERLGRLFGPTGEDALSLYRADSETYADSLTALVSDAKYRIPSIRLAELNSERQPTYMYLFSYRSPTRGATGLEYGAMHGLEVAFVFSVDTTPGYLYVGPRGTWAHLSRQMMQAWTNFARTGNPNGALLPEWPTYDSRLRATMEFGAGTNVVLRPFDKRRAAWDNVPTEAFDRMEVSRLAEVSSSSDR